MAKQRDLVENSRLTTEFRNKYIVHSYLEPDLDGRKKHVTREEYWEREKRIGRGSFGSVWLESCVKGRRSIRRRAVKQILLSSGVSTYLRELETIATFSKPEVCADRQPN